MSKIVLITGAAKRIGNAIAQDFAAKGWHVAAHYSASEKEARELAATLTAKGQKISLFQADLTQPHAARELFTRVEQTLGRPKVLINNACRFERDEGVITEQDFNAHMAANAYSAIELAQCLRGDEQRFVFNMLDHTLDMSWPVLSSYVLSKATLEEWTRRAAPLAKPDMHIFGMRLGPTLLNPRQSQAHFAEAVSKTPTKAATSISSILQTITKCMDTPHSQPAIFDL